MAVLAGVLENGKLVTEGRWKQHVEQLQAATVATALKKDEALQLLQKKLVASVRKRIPAQHFGILFSGGVDSTVIATLAQRFTADFTCYTVGVEGAKDLEAAAAVARKLHFSHHITVITEAAVEALLKRALAVIPEKDVVNAEVAVTALAAVELARQHGDTVLFSGLGSEEIFAGYRRHAEAKNVNEACWNGLVNMWRRDLLRDAALAEVTATTMLTPFLDKSLITTAMQVPGAWKISGSGKKIILREVATQLGVPADFAYRKKLAAQYGSSVSKAVRKLARKAGFSYKKDYLAALSQQVLQV